MKVLAIVPYVYGTSPGQRYRIEQWEPFLKDKGVEITYAPFETPGLNKVLYKNGFALQKAQILAMCFLKRFKAILAAGKYDLVYLYREASLIGPAFFERIVSGLKVPIIYDFDDAIFLPNVSEANSKFGFLKSSKKVSKICQISSQITVGNSFLADFASQHNKNVTIIPSTIDTDKYFLREDPGNDIPVIVWSGSVTTLEHLDSLKEVLQKLAKTEKFKLRVIGAKEYKPEGIDVENINWRAETEMLDLSAGDIGIMPLPDNIWSKGKCGMKALQYMGMGIPTVCTNIGMNSEIITDGRNGFLASNNEEWLLKLKDLLNSGKLREQIGNAGYTTIAEEYSSRIHAPRLLEVFKKALKDRN